MKDIAVEVSLYPLHEEYESPILDFIRELRKVEGLEVFTNQLSTQISGDYALIMDTLRDAMHTTFQRGGKYSFVVKILNVDIDPGKEVKVKVKVQM